MGEKEEASHAKKLERKDKVWAQGARDTSKEDAASAKGADAAARKAAAAAQEAEESGIKGKGDGSTKKKKAEDIDGRVAIAELAKNQDPAC